MRAVMVGKIMTFSAAADKLSALRDQLKKLGVNGFILPHADEYQSEYLPASAERLAWVTGFTGSAGASVILPDQAAAFTDGRYLIQIRQQVDPDLFEIVDITKASPGDWLSVHGKSGQVIGYDPKLYTPKQIKTLQDKIADKGLSLKAVENPVDKVWTDRPTDPINPAEIFPDSIAGKTSAEKTDHAGCGVESQKCFLHNYNFAGLYCVAPEHQGAGCAA